MSNAVLKRERARDAEPQVQLDYPTVYPYTRSFCLPRIEQLPTLGGFRRLKGLAKTSEFVGAVNGEIERVQTTVYGAYTMTHLWFGFVCDEPEVNEMRMLDHRPPIDRDDHVGVFLDTAHDHRGIVHFMTNPLAVKQGEKGSIGRGNRYWERKANVSDAIMAWDVEAEVLKSKWIASLAIPFETFGRKAPPEGEVWGVNFVRHRIPEQSDVSKWNATYRAGVAPWAFGDLYFGAPPVVLERIGLGDLMGSGGEATVWLRSRSTRRRKARVVIDTFADHGLTHFDHAETETITPAGSGSHVSLPYRLDVDSWADVRIRLRILGRKSKPLHEGWYLFGYENGQKLMVRFPRRKVRNPEPGAKGFMDKKRRYILSRFPEFERVTTAQGAPSDFVLHSRDGSVSFNLMEEGALSRIAKFLHDLFDNENDRLLGATFFVHQPAGMVYSNLETQLVHQLTPLSLLRFGSAQCCCHAAVLMGIVAKMEINETGRFYRCSRIGLEGHVITTVDVGGRMVLLDPSVGRFFYLWDDRTLATALDIAADLTLADRAGKGLRKYFEGTARFHYYGVGAGIWPPGAPAE